MYYIYLYSSDIIFCFCYFEIYVFIVIFNILYNGKIYKEINYSNYFVYLLYMYI